jgi:hypothetical protein
MDNTRTVTDAKQQKIKIKKDVITSSMSTIVDRTCYVFLPKLERETVAHSNVLSNTVQVMSLCEKRFLLNTVILLYQSACVPWKKLSLQVTYGISRPIMQC